MLEKATLLFLLYFASQYSGYPVPLGDPLPTIEYKSNINSVIPKKCNESTFAYTNMNNGHITLPTNFNISIPDHKCALAHELTHYLQFVNHRTNGNVELSAYRVSAMCFKVLYHDPVNEQWAKAEVNKHQVCE